MSDPTESIRREMVADINCDPGSRESLEARYGQVWDTNELREAFDVTGFMAPMVTVVRKSDNQRGSLMFQHNPRFYFSFSGYDGR